MKKPFYLFFTPCDPVDIEPIDHGNILQKWGSSPSGDQYDDLESKVDHTDG